MDRLIAWFVFHIFVFGVLSVDLFLFRKKSQTIEFKEALIRSLIFIGIAILFDIGIYTFHGFQSGFEFLTGYLIELSLSVDNLFVFLSIFTMFQVLPKYQHKILFWGIIGAIVMRASVIFLGISIFNRFDWIGLVFGSILIFTSFKMLIKSEENIDLNKSRLFNFLIKWVPFTDQCGEGNFILKTDQGLRGTPILLVLIVVEITDLIFAVDSIPAVIGVTKDPYIAYTSNIFAILGLRSLYFALAGLMPIFHYLKYGISGVLCFIGIKLCLTHHFEIPIAASLGIVALLLGISIIASVMTRK